MLRILLSLFLFLISANLWSASVDGVRLSHSQQGTRLVFDLDSDVQFNSFTLNNPDRLVIDLNYSKQNKKLSLPSFTDTPIRAIRHAVWNKNTLRLVLDLNHAVKYKSQLLKPNQEYPHRLVVDLFHPVKQQNTAATKVAPPPKEATSVESIEQKQTSVATTPPKAVKTKKTFVRKDIVIAIDAGHGGQDPGAVGKRGTKEKDVVLAIAKRLAKLVNKEPGMKAFLTRDRDVFISLRQRIKRAHNSGANMFISIHADAFKNTRAKDLRSMFCLSVEQVVKLHNFSLIKKMPLTLLAELA